MIDNDKMTPRKPLKNPMTWKGWRDWTRCTVKDCGPNGVRELSRHEREEAICNGETVEFYGHKPTCKLYTKEAFELEIDRLLTRGGFALAANQGRYITCSELDFANAQVEHMVKKTGLTESEVRTGLYEGTLLPPLKDIKK